MNSIFALWDKKGGTITDQLIDDVFAHSLGSGSEGRDYWLQNDILLANQYAWVTPEDVGQTQPKMEGESGCIITSNVRLDNRKELIRKLHLSDQSINDLSDADLILKAYLYWGPDCVEHFLGEFAFILWDPDSHQLFAARDALGARELYYAMNKDFLIMGSYVSMLLVYPKLPKTLNEAKIAKYLAVIWDDDVNTFYETIYHLPPAHCLLINEDSSRLWRYWDVDVTKTIRYSDPGDYAASYLELISDATQNSLRSTHPVGISLSGGLDSSTIAILAAEQMSTTALAGETLNCYSYVFHELKKCDEEIYAQAVITKASQNHQVKTKLISGDTFWPAPQAQDWWISRDYPFQDPYYFLLQAILVSACEEKTKIMLNGFYGDDLYSGEDYWLIDRLLGFQFGQIASSVKVSHQKLNVSRSLVDYGLKALLPEKWKNIYHRMRSETPPWVEWLGIDLLTKIPTEDTDGMQKKKLHFRNPGQRKRYTSLFKSGYPESVTVLQDIAQKNGMEYAFPFLDKRIVEFILSIPSSQISSPGNSRRLLRESMCSKLPDLILKRQDKALLFDLYAKGIYSNETFNLGEYFEHSQIVERGYVNPEWMIKELNQPWRTKSGHILWLLISLENWLRKYW